MILLLKDGLLSHPVSGDRHRTSYRRARTRWALQRVSSAPILLLGFLLELGWAFVGSLGLGIGVSSSTAGAREACLWLLGALVIAAATAGAVFLATPEKDKED